MKTVNSVIAIILAVSLLAILQIQSLNKYNTPDISGTVKAESAPVKGGFASYSYHSPRFTRFIAESYKVGNAQDPEGFYRWMSKAYKNSHFKYPGKANLSLEALLDVKRHEIESINDPAKRANAEASLGAWLHRMVKTTIPRFSLDRGFEFFNTVRYGERQCFLQSVLIAGMLQDAGVHAGVVMVNKNLRGEETNNGHAVTLVKLANGKDIIVDASEPQAFARHQGLFVGYNSYHYVVPVYDHSSRIQYYQSVPSRKKLQVSSVSPLDYEFLRSQFFYYRGERVPAGILAKNKLPSALRQSEKYLKTSVQISPQNPLAVYMLGRVQLAMGYNRSAAKRFAEAYTLYSRSGWVPQGAAEYRASTNKRGVVSAKS